MVIKNKYDKYIHCDVRDTRSNQTGHNYRLWIDKFTDEVKEMNKFITTEDVTRTQLKAIKGNLL